MPATAHDLFDQLGPMYGEAGICVATDADKAKILAELNAALPLLMKRLDAKGTLWRWKVPVQAGCFTLPFDCLEPRQVWLNGRALEQRDEWYEGKIDPGVCRAEDSWCPGHQLLDLGDGYALPYAWPAEHFDAHLGLMAEHDGDAGVQVRVELKNRYGEKVQETLTLPAGQQLAVSASEAMDVWFVHKGQTQGNVNAYIFYPQTRQRVRIAVYAPQVVSPSYRKKKLPGRFAAWCDGDGVLVIKGKKRFFPIRSEWEPLPIDDPQALGFAFRALTAQRAGNLQGYNDNLTLSLNELEKQMADDVAPAVVTQMKFQSPFGRGAFYKAWR